MNKEKLAISIKKQFGCSESEALAFSDDLIKAEGELNGRVQPFQEFAESTAGCGGIEDDLSEQVKARARAKAGLKSFKELANDDWIKAKIKARGGIRL